MKEKKKGFTLVELLIALSIIIAIAAILIGALNPVALRGKANDSKRKKDLDRIRKSFEEYFNDKDSYPLDIGDWNIKENCNSDTIFNPYLNPWPCDPNGEPYYIIVGDKGKSFKILTNLENENDNSIPFDWYSQESYHRLEGYSPTQVNYGVSSSNISWSEITLSDKCGNNCHHIPPSGIGCNSSTGGCIGPNCYRDPSCLSECQVDCCGSGCN